MEYRDYYATLDVPRNASQADIKRAYKKLARKYHPDVCKEADADKKFMQVREAYEALKDPKKRAAYDQLGDSWRSGQEFTSPPNWERNFHFSGDNFTQGNGAAFSDFFESLFGNPFRQASANSHQAFRGHHRFTTKGEDQHARIQIDIEDSFHGTTRTLTLQDPSSGGQQVQTISLRIPKGIREGQQIRLKGKGLPGQSGGANGDLYLEVTFRPHPFYKMEQKNLCLQLPIAPWEAALGAKVKLPTPTGPLEVTIPANSASGQTLRLSGRGLPGNPAGDMLVKLNIVLPKVDDEQSKALFRKMKDMMPFNPRSKLGV
ncbi:DnaJ C-terminal domain-containing protein [Photobacterium sp.]|uniref:DnaJ C-terminal domain-containing protein n=1 Tax=Photobacterium sp. TaxID=660 RepID=UPI00299E6C63|nr:DnaJ C-terminal domain-containing protein [Photobacterium sp.]MDX1300840.1 DnaJ C-terminal domain-containing protein [Photobacterium sp.]